MGKKDNIAKRRKRQAQRVTKEQAQLKAYRAVPILQSEILGLISNINKLKPFADEGCEKAQIAIARKIQTLKSKKTRLKELKEIAVIPLGGPIGGPRQGQRPTIPYKYSSTQPLRGGTMSTN
ncbi:MAG: hypothetical protein FWC73_11265 [Defluviitaleaceae bacterium]|nr:hypothetical protein [Defluviitaleaceae bacterium]